MTFHFALRRLVLLRGIIVYSKSSYLAFYLMAFYWSILYPAGSSYFLCKCHLSCAILLLPVPSWFALCNLSLSCRLILCFALYYFALSNCNFFTAVLSCLVLYFLLASCAITKHFLPFVLTWVAFYCLVCSYLTLCYFTFLCASL